MIKRSEIKELALKYAQLRNYKLLEEESSDKTLIFLTATGTKAKATPSGMKNWFEFKFGKKEQNNVFKLEKPKQIKKQWKAIACSMTTDELAIIDRLMKQNEIKTYNQFIRLVLLKVIEANK